MRTGGFLAALLAAAAAVVGLWRFGQTQPIEIVERRASAASEVPCPVCLGTRQVACSACNGSGFIPTGETTCPRCNGSGRVEAGSLLRRAAPSRSLGPSASTCPVCGGKGKVPGGRTRCVSCNGSGRMPCVACAGTGMITASSETARRTVRAGYSRWEKFLSWFGIEPDEDAPPQVRPNGSVPLVDAYLRLFSNEQRSARAIAYERPRRSGSSWLVTARVRLRESASEREESQIFRIERREVVDCRKAPEA